MKKNNLLILISLILSFVFIGCHFSPKTPAEQQPSGEIQGKAVYNNYDDATGIIVTLEKSGETSHIEASKVLNEDGCFLFNNLADGTYTVYASSNSSSEKTVSINVNITNGKSISIEDLQLTGTGNVSGTITLDDKDINNEGFLVFIAGTSYMAMTDTSGKYNISNVPAGSNYHLIVMKNNLTFSLMTDLSVNVNATTPVPKKNFTTQELSAETGSGTAPSEEIKFCKIIYELNGGQLSEDSPLIHIPGMRTELTNPVKPKYIFTGWYTDPECSGTAVTSLNPKDSSESITLYAKWLPGMRISVAELEKTISEYDEETLFIITDKEPDLKTLDIIAKTNNLRLDLSETSLTLINSYVFADCIGLKSITLPDSITAINQNAFENCEKLTKIIIPESVTYIAKNVFSSCNSLTTIYYKGSEAQWNAIDKTNADIPSDVTIIFNYTK